ncbi:MAG: twin-arginine translocase TatA/TatE family subunit [Caulobacteraceae bacterium]
MLGLTSPVHWIILLVVVAVLFGGRSKLSSVMGDAAKGIRAFKDGLKDDAQPVAEPLPQLAAPAEAKAK